MLHKSMVDTANCLKKNCVLPSILSSSFWEVTQLGILFLKSPYIIGEAMWLAATNRMWTKHICHVQTEVGYEMDVPFQYSIPFPWLRAAEHNLGNHMLKKAELQEGRRLDLWNTAWRKTVYQWATPFWTSHGWKKKKLYFKIITCSLIFMLQHLPLHVLMNYNGSLYLDNQPILPFQHT